MATVTGYTAARMKQIEDETVVDAELSGDDLILKRRDNVPINVGSVRGAPGQQGLRGDDADFGGYTEPALYIASATGSIDLDFSEYNSWVLNPTGAISLTVSNKPVGSGDIASGTLIILNDSKSITWPVGAEFHAGEEPSLKGITIVGLLLWNGNVYIGPSWSGIE